MNYYTADVISYSDYYPFGMLMPNGHGQDDDYWYGFNGMEKDDEVRNGKGNSYDFGARMLDPRIGRWLVCDPLEAKYAGENPYNFVRNNPIIRVDPDGRTDFYFNGKWIGTDGRNDNNVAIIRPVGTKSLRKQMKKNTKNGEITDIGQLCNGDKSSSYFVINRDVLQASYGVLKEASKDFTQNEYVVGLNEEGENFNETFRNVQGEVIREGTSESVSGGPIPDEVDVTIHSHPMNYVERGTNLLGEPTVFSYDASQPSPTSMSGDGDVKVFEKHEMNIIVGKKGTASLNYNRDPNTNEIVGEGRIVDNRQNFIFIFDSNAQQQYSIHENTANTILNDKKNTASQAAFEEKRTEN